MPHCPSGAPPPNLDPVGSRRGRKRSVTIVPRMRRRALFVSLLLLATTVAPIGSQAQTPGDPYEADPHRIVPFADTVQRV